MTCSIEMNSSMIRHRNSNLFSFLFFSVNVTQRHVFPLPFLVMQFFDLCLLSATIALPRNAGGPGKSQAKVLKPSKSSSSSIRPHITCSAAKAIGIVDCDCLFLVACPSVAMGHQGHQDDAASLPRKDSAPCPAHQQPRITMYASLCQC